MTFWSDMANPEKHGHKLIASIDSGINKKNLSEELVKILKIEKSITIDAFYDRMNIPQKLRTDFGTAAILNGAIPLLKKENIDIGLK